VLPEARLSSFIVTTKSLFSHSTESRDSRLGGVGMAAYFEGNTNS